MDFNKKKEMPIQGFTGFGGGTFGAAFRSSGADKVGVEQLFHANPYAGTGSSFTVTNGIDNSNEGGMIMVKARTDSGASHAWSFTDSVRGLTKQLDMPTNSNGQVTRSSRISSMNEDGYGVQGSDGRFNSSSKNYIAYNFRKCEKFFTYVHYDGDSTDDRAIAHDLGCTPGFMVIHTYYPDGDDWVCWHQAVSGRAGRWDQNNKWSGNYGTNNYSNYLDSTAPTATHFTVGNNSATNSSVRKYVCYLWAHNNSDGVFGESGDQDIIKCGSYTAGTNQDTITQVNVGFEPQFIMLKKWSTGENPGDDYWYIYDNMRGIDNMYRRELTLHDQDEDLDDNRPSQTNHWIHPTDNGFATKEFMHSQSNTSWMYMCIRKRDGASTLNPENGSDVFAMDTGNSSSTIPTFDSGFPVDLAFRKTHTDTEYWNITGRRYGRFFQYHSYSNAQTTAAPYSGHSSDDHVWDSHAGWGKDFNSNHHSWMWKHYTGMNSTITNYGTGSALDIYHGLGDTPEMVWAKQVDDTGDWYIYHIGLNGGTNPEQYYIKLNGGGGEASGSTIWNNTAPTSTIVKIGTSSALNETGSRIKVISWRSIAGISKVGYYTGNGQARTITTGFQPRFMWLKNISDTNAYDDTYFVVLDTSRGWASGNDSYLTFSSDTAQVTTQDVGQPTSSGFTLTAPIAGNKNEGRWNENNTNYIYYAHA